MGLKSDKQGIEYAAYSKPFKPTPNVPDAVSKLAKVRKFRSIGVFNTPENPDDDRCTSNISKLANVRKNGGNVCGHVEIVKLFDSLLALKLAYVKLQQAHIPYNPDKIRAADEEVVTLLDSLCMIKKVYKENRLKEANCVSACLALLLAEIQVQERALETLKSRAKTKDKEVATLRRELEDLETGNRKLADEVSELERESFTVLHYSSFENVVKSVGKGIHDFAKPLIALMKISGWDLDEAANAVQENVVYAKRSHKKYAFEAYVGRRMFHGFSLQPCSLENIMNFDEPIVALIEDPRSSFAEFCRTKYPLVVHPKMEESFFGNLDHRNFVANRVHPNTPFYRAFVRMARWVWCLQGFGAFIDPKAEMFGVKQGSEFSDVYMEIVEELNEYKANDKERYKVEFMVVPGFKLGETIIKSQVYVSNMGILKSRTLGGV